jgi:hypothetical protein
LDAVGFGRWNFLRAALEAAGPTTPGCEALPLCGVDKFLCAAEATTADKLNQTYAEYRAALVSALKTYDDTVKPAGGPFSPITSLTKCP